jgi:hypothetical protein
MDHDANSKTRWTFEQYWDNWSIFRDAVKKAVPTARFDGPDIAKELECLPRMAAEHPELAFLSGHYYAEGPPADPKMTLEFLLKRGKDPASAEFAIMQAATRQLGRPYRMTEGNSCFHGGKPLVSDTLASGLWSGDYMLQVAQAGYIGVNLHGGATGSTRRSPVTQRGDSSLGRCFVACCWPSALPAAHLSSQSFCFGQLAKRNSLREQKRRRPHEAGHFQQSIRAYEDPHGIGMRGYSAVYIEICRKTECVLAEREGLRDVRRTDISQLIQEGLSMALATSVRRRSFIRFAAPQASRPASRGIVPSL